MSDPMHYYLGMKSSGVLAAFFGGVVAGLSMPRGTTSPVRMVATVVGTITSIYVSPLTAALLRSWVPLGPDEVLALAGFVTGALGFVVVTGASAVLRRLRDRAPDVIEDAVRHRLGVDDREEPGR